MQVRAIMEAAVELKRKGGKPGVEIMIPLGRHGLRARDPPCTSPNEVAKEVIKSAGVQVPYLIGTMIEVPRAALTAGEIAASRRLLLVRDERPNADDLRVLP